MQYFYMLMGPSYSGKSTLAQSLSEDILLKGEPVKILSSDDLREELFGDANIQGNPNEIFQKLSMRTMEALGAGFSVIYDATNLAAKHRIAMCDKVKWMAPYALRVLHVCTPPLLELYDRLQNSPRERKVPRNVVNRQLMSFQAPTRAEGWDDIEYHFCETDHFSVLDKFKKAFENMEHDNPHHTLTITEHQHRAELYLREAYSHFEDADLYNTTLLATRYHDIGKYFTKTYKTPTGEKTDYAHYYGHENYGAYLVLSYTGRGMVAWLISNHMRPYDYEKYSEKTRRRFFDHSFKRALFCLDELHKADGLAK